MTITAGALYPVTASDDHHPIVAGTLGDIKTLLNVDLSRSGYSLTASEVLDHLKSAVLFYASWATLEVQRRQTEGSTTPLPIDETLALDADEWKIIEPLVRAECDVMQAYRSEAARSMGMDAYGLGVSEAVQVLMELKRPENLPKQAFVAEPFSIDLD